MKKNTIIGLFLALCIGTFASAIMLDDWKTKVFFVYASVILLGVCFLQLSITTELLRDSSKSAGIKPYSFSRTQLAYWSFLVIGGYMIINVLRETGEILNETGLTLLGISGATATAGGLIDSSDQASVADNTMQARHQDGESKGFFTDILSDAQGISIHRLQALVINLIYGVVLAIAVIRECELPEFSTNVMILLGLSSGTYAVLKVNENKTPKK